MTVAPRHTKANVSLIHLPNFKMITSLMMSAEVFDSWVKRGEFVKFESGSSSSNVDIIWLLFLAVLHPQSTNHQPDRNVSEL